jgi:hypothetical protein
VGRARLRSAFAVALALFLGVLAQPASANHAAPVLVSTGPGDNSTASYGPEASWAGVSSDGSRIFFTSTLHLVPGDEDGTCPPQFRITNLLGPVLRRVRALGGPDDAHSTGPSSGTGQATFKAASDDGSKVFFESTEPLVPEDATPSNNFSEAVGLDVYERSNGTTMLISTGPGGNGPPLRFSSKPPRTVRGSFSPRPTDSCQRTPTPPGTSTSATAV